MSGLFGRRSKTPSFSEIAEDSEEMVAPSPSTRVGRWFKEMGISSDSSSLPLHPDDPPSHRDSGSFGSWIRDKTRSGQTSTTSGGADPRRRRRKSSYTQAVNESLEELYASTDLAQDSILDNLSTIQSDKRSSLEVQRHQSELITSNQGLQISLSDNTTTLAKMADNFHTWKNSVPMDLKSLEWQNESSTEELSRLDKAIHNKLQCTRELEEQVLAEVEEKLRKQDKEKKGEQGKTEEGADDTPEAKVMKEMFSVFQRRKQKKQEEQAKEEEEESVEEALIGLIEEVRARNQTIAKQETQIALLTTKIEEKVEGEVGQMKAKVDQVVAQLKREHEEQLEKLRSVSSQEIVEGLEKMNATLRAQIEEIKKQRESAK
eukprot:CAMPEP_0174260146 /NCGR_PEP_ID=MMETSP0439-20130205/8870_1 /TAXON_ID=0 /ORGANISM="Stereomyxa ramosa, Strain Chinc5" /LENGTH=374 /DNA_ID=CAMNT_0015344321 /DNA_START=54 /DNA_END=1178 /DNA_ORIENTATION=+